MSEFFVKVVVIESVEKHPDADRLDIVKVLGDYPVIVKRDEYKVGDHVIYISIDAIVPIYWPYTIDTLPADYPTEHLPFYFLKKKEGQTHHRVKAVKLRGVFSMGLIIPSIEMNHEIGEDYMEALEITKWEPPEEARLSRGEVKTDPGVAIKYDIEGYRKYKNWLAPGLPVVITEKRHGSSSRFFWHNDEFYVGSRNQFKQNDSDTIWNKVALQYNLSDKLKEYPNIALYGEVFGSVQDLRYGAKPGQLFFECFDVLNLKTNEFFSWKEMKEFCVKINVPIVPILFEGPWSVELEKLADGQSTTASHIKEGIVIKAQQEWNAPKLGRCILKLVGENYLLR